ncbi:hypothetical protein [Shewanella sp. UCD-KL12]|uniref:hypothetical protein n=1 Tax=Shewanella sp. UCD-KL12 TaxID=1917163 RepID=UPI000970A515|nr:hypothetical protein [Shewanella sp. UCD-KL12]
MQIAQGCMVIVFVSGTLMQIAQGCMVIVFVPGTLMQIAQGCMVIVFVSGHLFLKIGSIHYWYFNQPLAVSTLMPKPWMESFAIFI